MEVLFEVEWYCRWQPHQSLMQPHRPDDPCEVFSSREEKPKSDDELRYRHTASIHLTASLIL